MVVVLLSRSVTTTLSRCHPGLPLPSRTPEESKRRQSGGPMRQQTQRRTVLGVTRATAACGEGEDRRGPRDHLTDPELLEVPEAL